MIHNYQLFYTNSTNSTVPHFGSYMYTILIQLFAFFMHVSGNLMHLYVHICISSHNHATFTINLGESQVGST